MVLPYKEGKKREGERRKNKTYRVKEGFPITEKQIKSHTFSK